MVLDLTFKLTHYIMFLGDWYGGVGLAIVSL